jgi:esterase/lipase
MKDFTKMLPEHEEEYIGENDLFLELYKGAEQMESLVKRPPLLFVHGAYTGSWMWSRYLPHFIENGWDCYVMNMRSHYKSRSMDMTTITFEDYLEDIREMAVECGEAPILIGFSLGGILCQKAAESLKIRGLILVDSCISREVNDMVPYAELQEEVLGMIVPAPVREDSSIDESEDEVAFQRKYLSMEASKPLLACGCWIKGIKGISVASDKIICPVLVIKSVGKEEDDRRGRAEAEHLSAEYTGFWNTSHTGLLVGQRYQEVTDSILKWLERY